MQYIAVFFGVKLGVSENGIADCLSCRGFPILTCAVKRCGKLVRAIEWGVPFRAGFVCTWSRTKSARWSVRDFTTQVQERLSMPGAQSPVYCAAFVATFWIDPHGDDLSALMTTMVLTG